MNKSEQLYKAVIMMPDFDEKAVHNAIVKMNFLRDSGIVQKSHFSDDQWLMYDEYRTVTFDYSFSEDKYTSNYEPYLKIPFVTFKDYVKTFCIINIGSYVLTTISIFISGLKSILEYPPEQLPENITDGTAITSSTRLIDFFSCLPSEDGENLNDYIIDCLTDMADIAEMKKPGNQRSLATVDTYFKFNDAMERFWTNCTDESQKLFYFPIWLWWNLTAVIPMRPRELILTPRKCLKKVNGIWQLKILKNNLKGSRKNVHYKIEKDYRTLTIKCSDRIANQIMWYQNRVSYDRNDLNTLFSTVPHYSYIALQNTPLNSRFYTYSNFTYALRRFFSEIVSKKYVVVDSETPTISNSHAIQLIRPGDTRHISLISMVLSGIAPTVAMELAGQENPVIAAHYYSNITEIVECVTYRSYRAMIKGTEIYALSQRVSPIAVKDFITLDNDDRCYSPRMLIGDFSDCVAAAGTHGEIGYCPECAYYSKGEYSQKKDYFTNAIKIECENLQQVVNNVRYSKGNTEDITSVILRLQQKAAEYMRYLMETKDKEEENAEN